MPTAIYGWVDNKNIYELIKNEYSEEDQKKLYNLLHYTVQKKLNDNKDIRPNQGINKWTPDVYKKEQEENKPTFISVLYKTQYSAYDKINRLQTLIDRLNYKYAINLKINFHYNSVKGYKFILYFGDFMTSTSTQISFDNQKLNDYTGTWNRIKDKFPNDPPQVHFWG